MFKPLLIHNNNTAARNAITNRITFGKIGEKSTLDKHICEEILPSISEKDTNILFIKDNLTDNYMDFVGLILAYYIRLTPNFKYQNIPIVILSDIDIHTINKLTFFGRIFFTKNVFFTRNKEISIKSFEEKFTNIIPIKDYHEEFLNLIEIKLPQDYSSNHDVTNEWSIYMWAEFLDVKSEAIEENKKKILSSLYFKYITAHNNKAKISKNISKRSIKKVSQEKLKVGYIDDDWNKGWSDIFNAFFKDQDDVEFDFMELYSKDKSYQQLNDEISSYIKNKDFDLIILDMRLSKSDYEHEKDDEISGLQILKLINEEINAGIKVIIMTASNRSAILEKSYEYKNTLGYIRKYNPSTINYNIENSYYKLTKLIEISKRTKYLKKIWQIQRNILNLNIFKNDKNSLFEIKLDIESIFDILNSDISNNLIYTTIIMAKILENISKKYINEEDKEAYWIVENKLIDVLDDNNNKKSDVKKSEQVSLANKIRNVMYFKLEIKDILSHQNIKSLTKKRNNIVHPEKTKISPPTHIEIVSWYEMIHKILKATS